MNRRDIVVGVIILGVLAAVIYYFQRPTNQDLQVPQTLSVEDQLEESFNMQLPDDVEKTELTDVAEGNASGIATRKFENGSFTHTVLADLPDPEGNRFYEGWLVRSNDSVGGMSIISTGRMRVAKGGYLLEFSSSTDLTDHAQVVITLEEVADATPETHILEGNF